MQTRAHRQGRRRRAHCLAQSTNPPSRAYAMAASSKLCNSGLRRVAHRPQPLDDSHRHLHLIRPRGEPLRPTMSSATDSAASQKIVRNSSLIPSQNRRSEQRVQNVEPDSKPRRETRLARRSVRADFPEDLVRLDQQSPGAVIVARASRRSKSRLPHPPMSAPRRREGTAACVRSSAPPRPAAPEYDASQKRLPMRASNGKASVPSPASTQSNMAAGASYPRNPRSIPGPRSHIC